MFLRNRIQLLRISVCNQACLVLGNITFRVMFDGDPFDTDGFSARWKLDEAPGLVLFNASNFLLHCFDPSIFVRSLNGLFGILIGGFDGGIKDFG